MDSNSAVRAHLFFKEEQWDGFNQIIDTYLSDASRVYIPTHPLYILTFTSVLNVFS
jgi:hypothetical protein